MANDPGLANDTCIFMEAISGDGGTHNPNDVWWLSPDISLVGPVSGPDNADPGQVNPVQVKFHRKPDTSNCNFPGDESLNVELWVANPSLAMAPNNHASTTAVGANMGAPVPLPGVSGSQQIDWTVPSGVPPTDPQAPGHKCLIARCYPSSLTPSNTAFFVPDDQHVAQHNICIVPCPQAALHNNQFKFSVATVNPDFQKREKITVRAVLDLRPKTFVRNIVLHRLDSVRGFQQLASAAPPSGFKFDLTGLHPTDIQDHSHAGAPAPPLHPVPAQPSFQATIVLASAHVMHLSFIADLSGTNAGQAFIFHLTQLSEGGHAQGGLTLVLVRL